jgi:DNA-binding transcriptional regulator YdaS (Cro superfamily)
MLSNKLLFYGMEKLIAFFGGRKAAADAIGVTPSYLTMIKNGQRKFSPEKSIEIDRLTNGRISKSFLRPDIFTEQQNL